MVCRAMGVSWNTYGIHLSCFAILILVLAVQGCWSLNSEGLALLEFRARVDYDPYGAFANWNPDDDDPCMWSGVRCANGKMRTLDLHGLSLEGELAPDLGKLSYLRSIVLQNNHFFGAIPKEIGGLTMLEVLDLRNNNLSGTIPAEFGGLHSLKRLLLSKNNFEGEIPLELGKLSLLSELQFDGIVPSPMSTWIGCVNRKFGHCIFQISSLKQLRISDSCIFPLKEMLIHYLNVLPLFKSGKDSLNSPASNFPDKIPGAHGVHVVLNVQNLDSTRRRLLQQFSNLVASPANGGSSPEQITVLPINRSSGSFPAVPDGKKGLLHPPASSPTDSSPEHIHNSQSSSSANKSTDQKPSSGGIFGHTWKYIAAISCISLLLLVAVAMFFMCRRRPVSNIRPWKAGLSGQLQKAFVTGVPKLNREELETACEDFSNIIATMDDCAIYKGTLSSGVEIVVVSTTTISSVKDWSKRSELIYRKKIDTLSRVNHKNFVNLLGYCEEDEPFTRMMVFEYAPNGTLFEHLHVKEVEHLEWNARMRIIMGTAYCLQYMHELNPPVAHSNLISNAIFLTEDYASKIAEIDFLAELSSKSKISGENESQRSELSLFSDPETNVHSFGVLLLEVISGKLAYSKEQGSLLNWANEYLNDKRSISNLVDPTLKSFENNELDIICEVIQDCIQSDVRKRPTMKEVASRLRDVIGISPDTATPKVSPLWWAELEILSGEGS